MSESDKLAKQLLEKAELQEPFFREQGKLFLKFDRIDVQLMPSPCLVYYWRGAVIITQPICGAYNYPHDTLTIGGIEGKTEVQIL